MSLHTSMQRTATMASRRFASTTAALPKAPVPDMYQYSFKKSFLSDPSTYPLLCVMTGAISFIIGASINGFTKKNVRINPAHKHETMNTWDTKKTTTLVERVTRRPPVAFHRQGFKDIRQEGLGIDHEQWKKGKDAL